LVKIRNNLTVENRLTTVEAIAAQIFRFGMPMAKTPVKAVATAGSLRDARKQMALQEPDIVLLDLMLPDGSGMELFNDAKRCEHAELVLITGHASLDTSIQALRLGAADYLVKPMSLKQLQGVLSRVTKPSALKAASRRRSDELERKATSARCGAARRRCARLRADLRASRAPPSRCSSPARAAAARKSSRAPCTTSAAAAASRPFLAVNCGAISPHLIESEIFGHEKGSFTGADRQHQGFFERATAARCSSTRSPRCRSTCRSSCCACSRPAPSCASARHSPGDRRAHHRRDQPQPAKRSRKGKLREDLLYRLNVFPIHLPPLRERAEDIPLIAEHFLDDVSLKTLYNRLKEYATVPVREGDGEHTASDEAA
jgi:two-component system response regulator AtoC